MSAAPSREALRVLVVISRYWPEFSGAAMQQHDLLRRLVPRVRATVLTLGAPGLAREETHESVRILRLGNRAGGRLGRLRFVAGVLLHLLRRAGEYDVAHVYSAGWAAFAVPLLARWRALPALYHSTLQGSDDAAAVAAQGLGALKVRLLRGYARVLALTPEQARAFVRAGFDGQDVRVLPCSVDDEFLTPERDDAVRRELRRLAGRSDEGPLVLFVGTLTARKGVDLLLESFELLLERRPSAVLVLLGPKSRGEDATLDERFVARIVERSSAGALAGHVAFLGRVDAAERKREVLRAADAFALFSTHEGFGLVILEAMACAVPPVLTPLPGVFDFVVENGRCGRIAASRDPAELAGLLDEVLQPECRARLGGEARREVERRFALRTVSEQCLALYRELSGATAGTGGSGR